MIFRFLAGAMADAALHHANGALAPLRQWSAQKTGRNTPKPQSFVAPKKPEAPAPRIKPAPKPEPVKPAVSPVTAALRKATQRADEAQEPEATGEGLAETKKPIPPVLKPKPEPPPPQQQEQESGDGTVALKPAPKPKPRIQRAQALQMAPAAMPAPVIPVASMTAAPTAQATSLAQSLTLDGQLDARLGGSSRLIWLVGATVVVFILWAMFAWVDEIVRANGEMISSSRPQIIQNLEGGILAELKVAEGDIVQEGDVLARLYGTEFQTNVDDLREQIAGLDIRRLRLEAEMEGLFDFIVPPSLAAQAPAMVASERALLNARQSDYVSRTDGARAVMEEARNERDLLERLLERKIVALIEVTRARKSFSDAQARYNEIVTQAELDRAKDYSEVVKELTSLRQTMKVSVDQLERTVLVSPLRGIVNKLPITTIGGVIRPGEEIAQIIPLDEELFVEAQVQPKDIANLRPGQEATVKLTAYDYTIYGSLPGRVHFISADTFKDERKPDGDPHYKVTVKLDLTDLSERQKAIEMRPGMQAQVELHTGEKTILQYLLKPLYKSREALREP